jgi:hypothetical protein
VSVPSELPVLEAELAVNSKPSPRSASRRVDRWTLSGSGSDRAAAHAPPPLLPLGNARADGSLVET